MKTIVIGSFGAVLLIILASFSSVVSFQTVESNPKNVMHSLKNRIQHTLDSIKDKKAPIPLKKLLNGAPLIEKLEDTVNKNGDSLDTKFKSIVNHCSSFHNTIANGNEPGRMLFVLVLTILTEFFVYLSIVPAPVSLLFLISVVINAITNPATNLVYYYIYDNVLVLEALVVIVESFMIFMLFNAISLGITFIHAIMLSLIANLASYIIATGLARLIYDILPSTTP